ncbi:hypothetical protein D9M71_755960 [compost metagenome]
MRQPLIVSSVVLEICAIGIVQVRRHVGHGSDQGDALRIDDEQPLQLLQLSQLQLHKSPDSLRFNRECTDRFQLTY